MFGICNLSIVPIRIKPSEEAEMVNQIVFGEWFKILDKTKNWTKIQLDFDGFEGFIDNKQYEEISEEIHEQLMKGENYFSAELIDFIYDDDNNLTTIPLGSHLPFYKEKVIKINDKTFSYDGRAINGKLPKSAIIEKAYMFLNVPYLRGGKTPFGTDSEGFVQSVYKLCGYNLLRKVSEMANQGEVLSFIEESEPGDLAFFDDEDGNITHVGIVMQDNNIIHSYGKVRIDKLDYSGIYNVDSKKHTHKLRMIKSMV